MRAWLDVSLDYSDVLLDNHTDYKDTWYFHVLTEYVSEDYHVLWLDNHTDYKDTWYLYV